MPVRVNVSPSVLVWARERSRRDYEELLHAFPHLPEWESDVAQPTLRQLEKYARATYTPLGLLLLEEPPSDQLPVPDFRTIGSTPNTAPSPNLLDAVYLCEQRQAWYRQYARASNEPPVQFVGSTQPTADVVAVAASMRETLGFSRAVRDGFRNWADALRGLIELAESAGALVMVSGIVASNTRRVLDPREFRGFALADEYAPLVFVNGTDTKAAQIFTLAHELAHLWLGSTGISGVGLDDRPSEDPERWCNAVAGELLVPLAELREEYRPTMPLAEELQRLVRIWKVSTLVMLRRIFDAGGLSWDRYRAAYDEELERVMRLVAEQREGSSGGNFYATEGVRVGKRFARAIVTSALEGSTPYRDASYLLGFRKHETFVKMSEQLGVA